MLWDYDNSNGFYVVPTRLTNKSRSPRMHPMPTTWNIMTMSHARVEVLS
jgi:hypothetical protein